MKSWLITILAAAALTAVAIYFLTQRHPEETAPAPPPVVAAPQKPRDMPLPPSADSDALVRKALSSLSPRPELGRWLSQPDLLDSWVVIADNLAEGVTPRKQLAFLAPSKPFMVRRDKIDPRSYARYDLFADVIGSIDAKGFGAAVRELHPLLESAYHKLGYPDRKLDDLARAALQRLIDAPAVEGDVAVVPKGALYRFADEKLESQGSIEKHLLRMGPRNTRLIQQKAREIAAALELRVASH